MVEYAIKECYPSIEETEALASIMASEGWRFKAVLSGDLAKNTLWTVYLFEREKPPVYVAPKPVPSRFTQYPEVTTW